MSKSSIGELSLLGGVGLSEERMDRLALPLQERLSERLEGLFPDTVITLDAVSISTPAFSATLNDDALLEAIVSSVILGIERRARAQQQTDTQAATTLMELVSDELNSLININEPWLLELLSGGEYRGKRYTPPQISMALDMLRKQTSTVNGFQRSALDILAENFSDEGAETYTAFVDQLMRQHNPHAALRLADQSTDYVQQAQEAASLGAKDDFLEQFKHAALQLLLDVVSGVEKQALDSLILYTGAGEKRGDVNEEESKAIYANLEALLSGQKMPEKLKSLEALRERYKSMVSWGERAYPRLQHGIAGHSNHTVPEKQEKWEFAHDEAKMAALSKDLQEAEAEYYSLAAAHPILLMRGQDAFQIEKYRGRERPSLQKHFRERLMEVLTNCRESKAHIFAGDVNPWVMPKLLEITKKQLRIASGSEPARWVEEEAKSEQTWQLVTDIALGVLEIGLGIAALFTAPLTGGGSLAAFAAVMVGGVAVGTVSTIRSQTRFETEKSLHHSTLDRYSGVLDAQDLDSAEKWLWFSWATVIGFGALDTLALLKTIKMAKAVKSLGDGKTLEEVSVALGVKPEKLYGVTLQHAENLAKKGSELPLGLARMRLEAAGMSPAALAALSPNDIRKLGSLKADELPAALAARSAPKEPELALVPLEPSRTELTLVPLDPPKKTELSLEPLDPPKTTELSLEPLEPPKTTPPSKAASSTSPEYVTYGGKFSKAAQVNSDNFAQRWGSGLSSAGVGDATNALRHVEQKLAAFDAGAAQRNAGINPRDIRGEGMNVSGGDRFDCNLRNKLAYHLMIEAGYPKSKLALVNTGMVEGEQGYHAYVVFQVDRRWFILDTAADQYEPGVKVSQDFGSVVMPFGEGTLRQDAHKGLTLQDGSFDSDWAFNPDLQVMGNSGPVYGRVGNPRTEPKHDLPLNSATPKPVLSQQEQVIANRRRFLGDPAWANKVIKAAESGGTLPAGLERRKVYRVDTRSNLAQEGFSPNPTRSWQTGQSFVHFSASEWSVQKYWPYVTRFNYDPKIHTVGQRSVVGHIYVYEIDVVGVRAKDMDNLGLNDFHSTNYPAFEDVVLSPHASGSQITRVREVQVTGEVVDVPKLPDEHAYWDYEGHREFPGGKDGWGSSGMGFSFYDLRMEEGGSLPMPTQGSWVIDRPST